MKIYMLVILLFVMIFTVGCPEDMQNIRTEPSVQSTWNIYKMFSDASENIYDTIVNSQIIDGVPSVLNYVVLPLLYLFQKYGAQNNKEWPYMSISFELKFFR